MWVALPEAGCHQQTQASCGTHASQGSIPQPRYLGVDKNIVLIFYYRLTDLKSPCNCNCEQHVPVKKKEKIRYEKTK